MLMKTITLAGIAVAISTSTHAATIATSIMDNNGEWSPVNQYLFITAQSGLSPTAGSTMMHFNVVETANNNRSDTTFSGLFLSAGTYTATIDVGSFTNRNLANIEAIGLTSDSSILATSSLFTPSPASGTWETWTLEYTVPNGSNLIGQALGFAIDIESTGVDEANIAFDNLRIDFQAAAVPVPAAAWLFGSGLLGLIGVARKRPGQ